MANSDKNIVITPNTGEANDPTIILTGGGNVPITIKSLDDSFGTVQFEGSNGSLFSINNNLSNGSLFNVNDGAGMPVMDIQEDGTVRFGGKISFPASSIPDGSITREKLSEDAQRVVAVTRHVNGQRVAWGDTSANTYWTIPVERKNPHSILFVDLRLSMRTNYSDCLVHECRYGDDTNYWHQGTMPYDAGFSSNSRPFSTTFWVDNINERYTGVNKMQFRWRTNNNGGGNKPAQIWNPNSGDDARYNQEISTATIWEIQP